jgi:hypothetical protein
MRSIGNRSSGVPYITVARTEPAPPATRGEFVFVGRGNASLEERAKKAGFQKYLYRDSAAA